MSLDEKNIVWHSTIVSRQDREELLGQIGLVILLTGLSGSGKSTIATGTEQLLFQHEKLTYILDGDNIRHGINRDLGFDKIDRQENMRRIGEIANLLSYSGIITFLSFIAPYEKERKELKKLIGSRYIEVHVDCHLHSCISRDPKGLYAKASKNEIKNFTGFTSPYERPIDTDLVINTDELSEEEAIEKLYNYIIHKERVISHELSGD